jgi:oxygen-independent coproporphyrinogen-3 oxidase
MQLASGKKPIEEKEILTDDQLELEAFYFGFRTQRGIDAGRLEEKPRALETLRRLTEKGLVKVSGQRVVPTRRGYLVADGLPLEFLD